MQNRIFWDTKECCERELLFDKEMEYHEKERELSLNKEYCERELSLDKEKDNLWNDRLSQQKMNTLGTVTPEDMANRQTFYHFLRARTGIIDAKLAQTK